MSAWERYIHQDTPDLLVSGADAQIVPCSRHFEAQRITILDGLVRFFLEGVKVQAEDNLAKARAILDL